MRHPQIFVDQGNAAGEVFDDGALLLVLLLHGLGGALALGDVLQRLDGTDQFAVDVEQRSRGEVQPSTAIAYVGEVVLGLVRAGNYCRAAILAFIESRDGIDIAGHHQIGHHRSGQGIERPPLIAAADHRRGRAVEHDLAGMIPVHHPVFPVDDEGRHRGTLNDLVEKIPLCHGWALDGFHWLSERRRWYVVEAYSRLTLVIDSA